MGSIKGSETPKIKDDPQLWLKSPYPKIKPVVGVELHEFVFQNIKKYGKRPAMACPESGRCLTYEQIYQQARAFGAALIQIGVKKGDIAAIILLNCIEYPVVIFGCWCAGMTVVTMNPRSTEAEIVTQFKSCDIRVVVTDAPSVDKVRQAEQETLQNYSIILLDDDVPGGFKSYQEMVKKDTHGVPLSSGQGTDTTGTVAWLAFSSGTTGPPKLVMKTHAQMILTIKQLHYLANTVDPTDKALEQDRFIAIFPFFHGGGMFIHTLAGTYCGAHTVVMSRYTPSDFLKAVRGHTPTTLHVPTPVISHIVNSAEFTSNDLQFVHTIMGGGSPVGSSLITRLIEKAGHYMFFQEGYGMTENSPISMLDRISKNRKVGSCGRVAPSITAKIVDVVTRKTLGPHTPGEILIKEPVKQRGYFRNEKATRELVDSDGWLRTGDVAYYDEEGYLYVVDRVKELIKVKAFQVAPSELEDLLRKHPDVADCAVIGIPSEEDGEVPRAFIVRKGNLSENEVHDYINPLVATYKQLKGGIEFVKSIVKTPAGKILRKELRQQYIRGNL